LDRADNPEDDWWDDPGDAALDAGAWLAGPGPLRRDDGPCSPLGAGPVEALPGLTPRRWGTGSGFDAGGMTDTLPPGPVLAGLAYDKWSAGLRLATVIGRAAGWTTGELRRAARRQVIAADPAAARRRKEKAAQEARVERWAEDAGTAALAGRDLPPAGVLAADAHLTAWAKRLKVAGVDGNLDQLRAQVYLTLLNGQPPEALLPAATGDSRATATGDCSATAASSPAHGQPPSSAASSPAHGQPPSGAASSPAHGQPRGPAGPSVRGSVNLVLPLSTWLGWSASPGEVAGFGSLDAADSRALAAALARAPATTWCVTITGADRRAVAHGCARAGPGQPPKEPPPPPMEPLSPQTEPVLPREGGPDPPMEPPSLQTESPSPREGGAGPPAPPRGLNAWLAGIGLAWLETGDCSHRRESASYRPSPSLAHLIQIRQQRCTAPGCRRPAADCDFEHAIPYHQGGRTCECNGGPCCRRHHRAKQAAGWRLSQPSPGTFVWTTPLGRSYQTDPEPYPT
jgi:hypothetical protein